MPQPNRVVLWQFSACHESGKVRRLLRQYGVPFTPATLLTGDKTHVRARFQSETVPVMEDGDFVSNDVTAICSHVEGKYGKGT